MRLSDAGRRWQFTAIALAAGGAMLGCLLATVDSSSRPSHAASDLPPTVSNVTVTRDATNPQQAILEFDSGLLGLRTTTAITLPARYDDPGAGPSGTLYWLHGTRGNTALGDMVVDAAPTPAPDAGAPGLAADSEEGNTEPADFLHVSLDAGAEGWCNSCWWVDGRNGQGVLAESHLLHEVIGVVEATFNVRDDRGGRAVSGSSMGGIGALIQAFRHPDVFSYVASQSGPSSGLEHDDVAQQHQDGLYYATYLVGQGYPDPVTGQIAYRNIDVVTLAPQVAGVSLEVVLWANDGCLPPYDPQPQPVGDPDCIRTGSPDPNDAFHMANEWGIRTDNEVLAARLLDLGVAFRLETGHGRHGPSSLYPDHIIPDLNRRFAEPPLPTPEVVSYKTSDRAFSIWGYDVVVTDRPNEEFVHLLGARTDGTDFTVAGTGSVMVTSPPVAGPGGEVQVTLVREDAVDESLSATTDEEGRLTLELFLGEPHLVDQRRQTSRQGLEQHPRTRVMIGP